MPVFEPRHMRLQSRILIRFLLLLTGAIALVVRVVDSRKSHMLLRLDRDRGLANARSVSAASASELRSYISLPPPPPAARA